jgi:hypothetical protein
MKPLVHIVGVKVSAHAGRDIQFPMPQRSDTCEARGIER